MGWRRHGITDPEESSGPPPGGSSHDFLLCIHSYMHSPDAALRYESEGARHMAAPRAPPRRFSSSAADFFPARALAARVPRGRRARAGARAPPRGGRRGRFRPARPRIRRARRWGHQTVSGPGSRAKAKRGRNVLPIAIRVNFTELYVYSKDP